MGILNKQIFKRLYIDIEQAAISIKSNKIRILITLLGQFAGVSCIIAVLSLWSIINYELNSELKEIGANLLKIEFRYDSQRSEKTIGLKRVINSFDFVQHTASYQIVEGDIKYQKKKFSSIKILGITESFLDFNKIRVKSGRNFTQFDQSMYYAIIGNSFLKKIKKNIDEIVIGDKISINQKKFVIIGTINNSIKSDILPQGTDHSLMVPISRINKIGSSQKKIGLMVKLYAGQDIKSCSDLIYKKLSDIGIKDFIITDFNVLISQKKKEMNTYSMIFAVIGIISLLVGGISLTNILLAFIEERKKEIGIRRIVGAKRKDILIQFLVEANLISFIGSVTGVIGGTAISYTITLMTQWNFHFPYFIFIILIGFPIFFGLFFGFYPAYYASRTDPLKNLND